MLVVLAGGNCHSQFYNNGSQISLTNGALLYVSSGDLINNDSTIYNSGKIVVDGNCTINNNPGSRIITANGDSLVVYKNFSDGSKSGQNSGVLVLKGSNQTISTTSQILANVSIRGTGFKNFLGSTYIRYVLDLQDGYINVPAAGVFALDSTASITQNSNGAKSFVIGTLYRKKSGFSDSLFFPIGDGANLYRPATLLGIATPGGKYPTFGLKTQIGTPVAGSGLAAIYNRTWNVFSTIPNFPVDNIRLAYIPTDVASKPLSNLVVAQSNSAAGSYSSIGNISSQSRSVISEFAPTASYYAIGSTNNVIGNFRVILEGPFNGTDMDTKLLSGGALSDSLLPTIGMFPGYPIPADAVDRIAFILKSGTVAIDTAYSWLIKDGTIRDYRSGTKDYVVFSKAIPGNSYTVVASHRNHLPAASSSIKLNSVYKPNLFDYDYTTGVFGGGALFNPAMGKWMLYAADSYRSAKNQTDVMDAIGVGQDVIKYVALGNKFYKLTDVNLDGKFDSKDSQLSDHHNSKLYYSTLP